MFSPGPLIFFVLFGGAGVPMGVRLGEEDPALLAIAPEECLVYASWADVGKPDPESENQVDQWLSEPEVQIFQEALRDHLLRLSSLDGLVIGPETDILGEEEVELLLTLLSHPAAAYIESIDLGFEAADVRAGLLIALGDDVETVSEQLEDLQSNFLRGQFELIEIEGESFYQITIMPSQPKILWGIKDNYLLVGAGRESISDMLGRMGNAPPTWLIDLREKMSVEKVSIFSYADLGAILEQAEASFPLNEDSDLQDILDFLDSLGLTDVREYVAVIGFDEGTYVSRSHVGIEGEPEGLHKLLAGDPLPHDALAQVPGDSIVALAVRVDPAEAVTSFVEAFYPYERERIAEEIERIKRDFGIDLFEDLLEPIGDTGVVYASPSEGGGLISGFTAIIAVDDVDRLRAANEQIWEMIQEEQDLSAPPGRLPLLSTIFHKTFFRKATYQDNEIYYLAQADDEFPFLPAWCITDDALILSVFPQNIRAYLSRDDSFESLLENEEVVRSLEETSPFLMTYIDPAATYKMAYPWIQIALQMFGNNPFFGNSEAVPGVSIIPSPPSVLPHLQPSVRSWSYKEDGYWSERGKILPGIDVSCAMPLVVAVSVASTIPSRQAAEKNQSRSNMRQLCRAIRIYESSGACFPAAYSTDDEGNPLLSWRVHILPYIEEQDLYEQFHLDEPWDSEHNRPLIEQMPEIFSSPSTSVAPGETVYLAILGEGSVIVDPIDPEDPDMIRGGRRLEEIRGTGTRNTIMLVEAKADQTIEWTRPGDYTYSDMEPAAGLGTYDYFDFPTSIPDDLFLAGSADGYVQALSVRASSELLLALFNSEDFSASLGEASPHNLRLPDELELDRPAAGRP